MAVELVSIERVTVGKGRLTLLARLAPGAPRAVSPQLIEAALAAYPSLPHHACVNDAGPIFAAVMRNTSVPHLLEHLIIDEQARDPRTPCDLILTGTTEWLDERGGLARVEVNFADDLVALRAMRAALTFINRGMVG